MDKIVKKRRGTSDQSLLSYSKTFANFCKPIHDIVNYSAITFFQIWKVWQRARNKIKMMKYEIKKKMK